MPGPFHRSTPHRVSQSALAAPHIAPAKNRGHPRAISRCAHSHQPGGALKSRRLPITSCPAVKSAGRDAVVETHLQCMSLSSSENPSIIHSPRESNRRRSSTAQCHSDSSEPPRKNHRRRLRRALHHIRRRRAAPLSVVCYRLLDCWNKRLQDVIFPRLSLGRRDIQSPFDFTNSSQHPFRNCSVRFDLSGKSIGPTDHA